MYFIVVYFAERVDDFKLYRNIFVLVFNDWNYIFLEFV